jgi:hypothetical protein
MEPGFEDDFAPLQSSLTTTAQNVEGDAPFILGDEEDSPKKTTNNGDYLGKEKKFESTFKNIIQRC